MGRVIGAQHIDDPLLDAAPDRLAVLEGRAPAGHLQFRSEPRVILAAEGQMMWRRLATRDILGALRNAISSAVEICSTCTRARASRASAMSRCVDRSAAISSRQTGCEAGSPGMRRPLRSDKPCLVLAVEGGAAAGFF